MIITIRPATIADAEYIGARLREEDEREVLTASGRPGTTVVPESLAVSQECYAIRLATPRGTVEDSPSVLFGVGRDVNRNGVIWLLGTRDIDRARLAVLREARPWIDHFVRKYGTLHNWADVRNNLHIRWIQLLGFTRDRVCSVNGQPFQHFLRTDV